jgi:hypothetical protein
MIGVTAKKPRLGGLPATFDSCDLLLGLKEFLAWMV